MRINDLVVGELSQILLRRESEARFGAKLQWGLPVRLAVNEFGALTLVSEFGAFQVEGVSRGDARKVDEILVSPRPYLACISGTSSLTGNSKHIVITCRQFSAIWEDTTPLQIIVPDHQVDVLLQRKSPALQAKSEGELLKRLTMLANIETDTKPVIAVSIGFGDAKALPDSFQLHCGGYVLHTRTHNKRYEAIRVTRWQPKGGNAPIYLLHTSAEVVSERQASASQQSHILAALISTGAVNYLRMWRGYNEYEAKRINQRRENFGEIAYSTVTVRPGGSYRLTLKHPLTESQWDTLKSEEESAGFELGDIPARLESSTLEQPENIQRSAIRLRKLVSQSQIEVGSDAEIPKSGSLHLSIAGSKTMLERRRDAWQRIMGGSAPLPGLGLLLEQSDCYRPPPYRPRRLKRAEVKEAFGDIEPNPAQLRALEIALNTPDIALIQGPPGTGKTQVIAALNRLIANERLRKEYGLGRVLLTAAQHDAVDNLATRGTALGFPAYRIGKRWRSGDTAVDPMHQWVQNLREELSASSSQEQDSPTPHLAWRQIQRLYLTYQKTALSLPETKLLLRRVITSVDYDLPPELTARLEALYSSLECDTPGDDVTRAEIYRAAVNLRVEEIPFQDDGPQQARILQNRLREAHQLTEADKVALEQAWKWHAGEPLDFLASLAALQDRLRTEYAPTPRVDMDTRLISDVAEILREVVEALFWRRGNESFSSGEIVQDLLSDLENDWIGVQKAYLHYAQGLASTLQQSEGRAMRVVFDEASEIEFDTVIVDEAARANPLDLMIPLSRARRRIILVGDHRQLPQLLEPEIERELETSDANEQELLRKSLFERLFTGIKQKPFSDGIPRQVTLNSQYRMHPKLGKFVSEQFYEEHGEAFTSERGEVEFKHNLDRFPDKVAVWIDCPFTMGKEERQQNSSWCRPREAQSVAAITKKLLDSNPDLGVGVITFYAQQREAIFRELESVGVTTHDEQGIREFADAYRYLKDNSERLRVGTVDAFQGKEFDVVILSLTRSNSTHVSPGQKKDLLRKYGFLTLKNRLCVAMSRQKMLLIVVGDSGMVTTIAAREAVPALSAFYELCTDPIYGQIN